MDIMDALTDITGQPDTKPTQLSPLPIKHEQVLSLLLLGGTPTAAYRQIYQCSDSVATRSSARLIRKDLFNAHFKLARAQMAADTRLSSAWVLGKLKDLVERCTKAGKEFNPGAANKSLELIGKHFDTFKENANNPKDIKEAWTGIEIDYGDGKLKLVTGTGPSPLLKGKSYPDGLPSAIQESKS